MTEHGSRRHDGWVNQADLTDADIANLPMPDAASPYNDTAGRQIVFIDGSVPDAQMLAADVRPGVVAVLLDPGQDGVQQIADWLASHHAQNLAAIDIVAHGADGEVELGSTLLNAATIGDYLAQLAQIGAALQPGGDIQLYGCDVAQDATGDAFLQQLSQATGGANIAASSHLVGSAAQGGSWTLNVNVGTVDVASPFTATALSAYPALLNLTNNQIFLTTWNGEVGANATGNRVEQIGVSGSTFISGSTIDLADASIDSGMTSVTSGIAVNTALNEYFVAVDNPVTGVLTIQKGTISAPGSLSTFYTVPFQDFTSGASTIAALGGLALDAQQGKLYFAQDVEDGTTGATIAGNTGIYEVSVSGGTPILITSTSAGLQNPLYLTLDPAANLLFFDDAILAGGGFPATNNLDAVNLTTGAVTVLHSFSSSDPFFLLQGMDINTTSNTLYLTTGDFQNASTASNAILSIPFSVSGSGSTATASIGTISTLYSGSGAFQPSDIVIDPAQGIFYTTGIDSGSNAGVFEGSLSGGSSLTEVLSMSSVVSTGAALNTHGPQLVLDTAPVLGASGTVTAISGGSAKAIDTAATVSDQSGQLLTNATVSGVLTGDTLSFNGGSTFTFGDGDKIGSSFSGGTLTLSGNATAADYQSALDSVTFITTSTNAAARTINWTISDGVVTSATPTSTVLVHVPPVVTAGATVTFNGGGSAVTLDSGLTVSDASSTTLNSGTISIAGFISGDTLTVGTPGGLATSFSNGTLTLSGSASVATYQTALDSVAYSFNPSNGDPTGGGSNTSRTIDWTVNDGVLGSGTVTSTLNVVHVAPTIAAAGTVTFTGGSGATIVLDSGLALTDPDSNGNLSSATITVGGFISGDTLTVGTPGGLSTGFSNGTLTLSGSASIATYQTALASVTYSFAPSNGDPTGGGSHTSRTIAWLVNDGVATGSGSSTLDTVHAAPTVTAGASVNYPENAPPVVLDAGLTVTDPDSGGNLAGATVSIGSGFISGDTLNFTNQNGITSGYNNTTGVLTLTGTASIANYQTALQSITYSFSGDPTNGGTDTSRTISWVVNDGAANSAAANSSVATLCFCAGTPIATPTGEVPVERLAIGDLVLTLDGRSLPIRWIGTGQSLLPPGRRTAATPVIVRAGALADDMPRQDLRITKGHSLYLEGLLIPVENLINHRTILWDDAARSVVVYHIELDTHEVLLANGAPAESYRDDGNRVQFQNVNPDWDVRPAPEPFAPIAANGPVVAALWERLLQRAGPPAPIELTEDPDVHLSVDGVRVVPSVVRDQVYGFEITAGSAAVRIASRSAVQSELGLNHDHRRLGVAVRRIVLRQHGLKLEVEADALPLQEGFHLYEADGGFRWTDGAALLPASVLGTFVPGHPLGIEVHVGCTARYRAPAGEPARAARAVA